MKRTGGRWAVGLCLWLASGCQGPGAGDGPPLRDEPSAAAEASDNQTVWLVLREQANLSPARTMHDWRARGEMVFERLTGTARRTQAPLEAELRRQGVESERFWIVNAVRIKAAPWLIRLLGNLPEVASIHPDRTISLPQRRDGAVEARSGAIEWGVENIRAPAVWSAFGFRGEGIVVGNIDTGVDFEHPALRRQYRGRRPDGSVDHNYSWFDPAGVCGRPSPEPCDNAGHGTHTIGIVVGEDERDPSTNRIGVAPRARWIAAKGCESGDCSLSSLLRAGEWMLAPTDLQGANPRPDLRPHIVNNSWSAGAGDDPFFASIVKAWVAAGIFPAFASGNDGPDCGSADSPADYAESYAVGAHDKENRIAPFSSRGETAEGGQKPNISAPGVNIRSSFPGGGYGISNGTSMATPHVSGAVALIWSAAPSLIGDVASTRTLLDQTAIDSEDLSCGGSAAYNNVFGEGRLDVFAAVELAPRAPTGVLAGAVRSAPGGAVVAVPGARVRAQGVADRTSVLTGSSAYGLVLPAGSYTVTASAFGYVSQALADVRITGEERTVRDFILERAPTHLVRGLIRQPDGRPLAGVRVLVEGTPLLAVVTNNEGVYQIAGLPAGAYQLSASRGGCFDRANIRFTVETTDAELNVTLDRQSQYSGSFCEPQRLGFAEVNAGLPAHFPTDPEGNDSFYDTPGPSPWPSLEAGPGWPRAFGSAVQAEPAGVTRREGTRPPVETSPEIL